jgi:hypothetical protein
VRLDEIYRLVSQSALFDFYFLRYAPLTGFIEGFSEISYSIFKTFLTENESYKETKVRLLFFVI